VTATAPLGLPEWSPIPDWFGSAACRGIDADLFFPERGQSVGTATAICRGCPVRVECLAFSMTSGEKFGIWGGLAERPRRRLRRDGRVETRDEIVVFDRAAGTVTFIDRHAAPVEPVAAAG
jgi:WhiB family redox-sensing transcriptional regulator